MEHTISSKNAKEMLAHLRQGDFAHPGEIEAIKLAMRPIIKNKSQLILDVGCGLGGTADYMQQQGFGQVIGIDLDNELIEYAEAHYPDVVFLQSDILQNNRFIDEKFQLIYCFSSFFCFTNQPVALKNMAMLAEKNADLVLFDYAKGTEKNYISPFPWSKTASHFVPIDISCIEEMLNDTGWQLQETVDVSEKFKTWYTSLLEQFQHRRQELVTKYSENVWDRFYQGYSKLLNDLEINAIGGTIIYAKRD